MSSVQIKMLQKLVNNTKNLLKEGYYTKPNFNGSTKDLPKLLDTINSKFVILGEIKPASPMNGIMIEKDRINHYIDQIGSNVDGISVLTEPNYFGGSLINTLKAFPYNKPILMKDFIIDKIQIDAAICSAILLIDRILDEEQKHELIHYAQSNQLEVVLEVDNEKDFVQNLESEADILAINNRNLDTMAVDTNKAGNLVDEYLPVRPVIGLSGYKTLSEIEIAKNKGLSGVLIGSALSSINNPGEFLQQIQEVLG